MSELVEQSVMDIPVQQHPYPYYRALRENAPVRLTPEGTYLVTTYELVLKVVQNPKIFSSMSPHGGLGLYQSAAADALIQQEGYGRSIPVFVNLDPPSHTYYRKLVMNAFRPARIRQMEQYVDTMANSVIDSLADKEEFDAVQDLAIPLQIYVIADQLGVARSDFRLFREWSDAWFLGLGLPVAEEEHIIAAKKIVELQHYLMARIEERRVTPGEDVISDFVRADLAGERPLTNLEVLAMAENILVAGHETTSNSIAAGLYRLAQDAALQARLRADPSLTGKFVEEILRTEAPVQMMPRYVTEDTELSGVPLAKGAVVMVAFAAANRDAGTFDDAESFNIDRPNLSRHLSFGAGIHACVGSQLAKLVLNKTFKVFLNRFSTFQLAHPDDHMEYNPSFVLRGLKSLYLNVSTGVGLSAP
jgi:cytochrome P450